MGFSFKHQLKKNEKVASAAKNSPAWDEDWTLPTKSSASRDPEPANSQFNKSTVQSQPSNQTTVPTTCSAVDIEWPPRQSTNVKRQFLSANWFEAKWFEAATNRAITVGSIVMRALVEQWVG